MKESGAIKGFSMASVLGLYLMAMMIIMLLIIGTVVHVLQQRSAVDRVRLYGETLATNFSYTTGFIGLESGMLQTLTMSLKTEPNILQVLLVDNEFVIQASSTPQQIGSTSELISSYGFIQDTRHYHLNIKEKKADFMRILTPILSVGAQGRTGTILLDIDLNPAHLRAYKSTFGIVMALFLFSLLITLSLFLCVHWRIIRPITNFKIKTEGINQGGLDKRIHVEFQDELGELANTFNQMLDRLESTLVSKSYVEGILDSMGDMLFVLSPELTIERVNAKVPALLRYSEEELLGQSIWRLFDIDIPEAEVKFLLEHYYQQELQVRCKDGRLLDLQCTFSPLYSSKQGSDLQVLGIVCNVQDITLRKQAEIKLQRYAKLLEETKEESKSFAYIVSHDLRAPLVNIKGFSGELDYSLKALKEVLGPYYSVMESDDKEVIYKILDMDMEESLSFINTSVMRMNSQINGILKISRLGYRKLQRETVDMQKIASSVRNSLKHQLETNNIEVIIKSLPKVYSDPEAMEQILGNLMDNAVKYIPAERNGVIEISSSCRKRDIVFHVKDNGCGIAEQHLSKVFDMFKRVGNTDISGEGMGLTYVKTLIRQLGGDIWCESQVNQGAIFSFSLPLSVDSD